MFFHRDAFRRCENVARIALAPQHPGQMQARPPPRNGLRQTGGKVGQHQAPDLFRTGELRRPVELPLRTLPLRHSVFLQHLHQSLQQGCMRRVGPRRGEQGGQGEART